MSNVTPDELIDIVYYVLERHASYICNGPDDDVKYYIPQEILEVLVWIVLNVSLPVLTGITTSVLADRLKKKVSKEYKALELKKNELECLKADVIQALNKLNREKTPGEQEIQIAQVSLQEILSLNGWPPKTAVSDAENVLVEMQRLLWKNQR